MRVIVGFVGVCLFISSTGLPVCAIDTSAASVQSRTSYLADAQPVPANGSAAAADAPSANSSSTSSPLSPDLCSGPAFVDSYSSTECSLQSGAPPIKTLAPPGNKNEEASKVQPTIERLPNPKPPDLNRDIFYRNKLEFSLDGGYLPINVPFPLDIFVGDAYNSYPLKYTLVPIIASLRWHVTNIGGFWILRGNWDVQFSGSITGVARGPENRYFTYIMGIRRNFVPRNSRIAPYFDVRLGVGHIDAKGPKGILYAQGQDITFNMNMGSGIRYTLNPRYSLSAGLHFMHISNLDLSESNGKPNWGVRNYGINVYGPMVGIDIRLGKGKRHPDQ